MVSHLEAGYYRMYVLAADVAPAVVAMEEAVIQTLRDRGFGDMLANCSTFTPTGPVAKKASMFLYVCVGWRH